MAEPRPKILITGSSGSIGTRLFEKLLAEGRDVYGADLVQNRWHPDLNERTTIVDLRDRVQMQEKLPMDVDVVVHLAANARVYDLIESPTLARDNFETTFNILEFVRAQPRTKLVFASSREVYGNADRVAHSEDNVQVQFCESPYAASKLAGEALVFSYGKCYGLDFVTLRFSNVYGMYDTSERIIPLFISRCKKGEDLVIYGEDKVLDFTYIDDCVAGILSAIDVSVPLSNNVYNIANGEGTRLLDLAHMLQEYVGRANNVIVQENRTGEVVHYVADIARAKKDLGYSPQVSLEDGLRKAVEWYGRLG